MSLVNNMLRDLEAQRSGDTRFSHGEKDVSLDALSVKEGQGGVWLPAIVAFLVVTVLILIEQVSRIDDVQPDSEPAAIIATESTKTESTKTESTQTETEGENTAEVASQITMAPNFYPGLMSEVQQSLQDDVTDQLVTGHVAQADSQKNSAEIQQAETSTQDASTQEVSAQTVAVQKPLVTKPLVIKEALSPEQELKVGRLLSEAEQALAVDRLTSPVEDNAYDRFQQVLALDPDNIVALAGVDTITMRYVLLAEDYAQDGNILRAKVLLRRAAAVSAAHPAIKAVMGKLPQYGAATTGDTSGENNTDLHAGKNTDRAGKNTNKEEGKSASFVLEKKPAALNLERSDEWQDNEHSRKAQKLLAQGNTFEAQKTLVEFLKKSPRAEKSMQVLFHSYLAQGDVLAARALLQDSSYLPAYKSAEFMANIFVALDDDSAAIRILETHTPAYENNGSYYALLAGLYHQSERYQESATVYRQLVQQVDGKAEYWLGLAVALDALQDTENALSAFQRAQQGNQTQDVQSYIASRISALSS